MNTHIVEGEWKQLKGAAKEKWGKLTQDEIDETEGETQKLIGKIQAEYGYEYEKACGEVKAWLAEHRK